MIFEAEIVFRNTLHHKVHSLWFPKMIDMLEAFQVRVAGTHSTVASTNIGVLEPDEKGESGAINTYQFTSAPAHLVIIRGKS